MFSQAVQPHPLLLQSLLERTAQIQSSNWVFLWLLISLEEMHTHAPRAHAYVCACTHTHRIYGIQFLVPTLFLPKSEPQPYSLLAWNKHLAHHQPGYSLSSFSFSWTASPRLAAFLPWVHPVRREEAQAQQA